MTHYGGDEYKHLEGRTLMDASGKTLVIFRIVYAPDSIYYMTDGHAGNAYQVFFEESNEVFGFRHFSSVVEKYGKLVPDENPDCLCESMRRVLTNYDVRVIPSKRG